MEFKIGEKTVSVDGWVAAVALATVGTAVANICKTFVTKRK